MASEDWFGPLFKSPLSLVDSESLAIFKFYSISISSSISSVSSSSYSPKQLTSKHSLANSSSLMLSVLLNSSKIIEINATSFGSRSSSEVF